MKELWKGAVGRTHPSRDQAAWPGLPESYPRRKLCLEIRALVLGKRSTPQKRAFSDGGAVRDGEAEVTGEVLRVIMGMARDQRLAELVRM
jgi:hypothetical protein